MPKLSYQESKAIYDSLYKAMPTVPTEEFRALLQVALESGYHIDYAPRAQRFRPLLIESMLLPASKDSEICSIILEAGADVNLCDRNETNALMYAVNNMVYNVKIIGKILSRTKDINAKNKWGHTALGYLCSTYIDNFAYARLQTDVRSQQKRAEIIKAIRLLVNAEADVDLDESWKKESVLLSINKTKQRLKNLIVLYQEQKQAFGESSVSTQEDEYEL